MGIVLFFACFPGVITSLSPTDQDAEALLKAPSLAHLFGTDNFGRDIFARVVYGTRIDLIIGVLAMIVPFVTGSLIGLVAGYYGKWVDIPDRNALSGRPPGPGDPVASVVPRQVLPPGLP